VIDGKSHGLGSTVALASALVASGCGTSRPAVSVASDGTNFLVVGYACNSSSGTNLSNWVGILVGPDGATLNTVNITQPAVETGSAPYLHSVSGFDGTHYLVVYEDSSASLTLASLQSVVLGTDGSIIAGPTQVATAVLNFQGLPTDNEALGYDGNRFLLIYTDGASAPGTSSQVTGQFLTPGTGQAAGAKFNISQGATAAQGSPAIAFDGTNYLVAYIFSSTSPVGLFARRVSPSGTLVDTTQLVLVDLSHETLKEACCDLEPSLAFDGTNYLVAYRDPRSVTGDSGLNYASISAARVSTAGVLLDGTTTSPGIIVAASKSTPRGRVRTVFMDGVYWLVWESSNPVTQLSATRVSTAGVTASAWTDGFTMAPQQMFTQIPVLGTSSNGSLLTWLQIDANTSQTQLLGIRIYPIGP
jgi:hypothetical protein